MPVVAHAVAKDKAAQKIAEELVRRFYGFNYPTNEDGYPTNELVERAAQSNHTVTLSYDEFIEISGFKRFPKHLHTAIEWWAGDYGVVVGFGLERILIASDAPLNGANGDEAPQ